VNVGSSFQTAPVVVVSCLRPVPRADIWKIWTLWVLETTASKVNAPFRPGNVPATALVAPALTVRNTASRNAPALAARAHGELLLRPISIPLYLRYGDEACTLVASAKYIKRP
jgi:hypothetical protein